MSRTFSHFRAWEEEHRRGIWKGPYSLDFFHKHAPSYGTVLDAGCGIGRYTIPLAMQGYDILGVDISPGALGDLDAVRLRRNLKMGLAAADISHLPFHDSIFHIVVCFGVLQHLLEAERTIAIDEFNRVLIPGGILIIEVLGRDDMRLGGYEVEPFTFRRDTGSVYHYFNLPELKGLLADFEVLDIKEERKIKDMGGSKRLRHMIYAAVKATERDK
ncbi:MAG: class I SAM-dependent methyltransferase [ANME-2 cluster archaeon]|nr:class I SAM-dependent methyltransferase [ANME-2 cluster archaeon]